MLSPRLSTNSKNKLTNMTKKKSKLKKYCVTETIYVTCDVLAKNEDEAKQIFDDLKIDQYDYQSLINNASSDIEVQQYE